MERYSRRKESGGDIGILTGKSPPKNLFVILVGETDELGKRS
jgi:hypothetical protein